MIDGCLARQEERQKGKKKKVHTPFLPNFARQTKHARKEPVASTSASTLDNNGPTPAKKRKVSLAHTLATLTPRESSRKSAVAFKKTIEERLVESEQRRVRYLAFTYHLRRHHLMPCVVQANAPKPVKKAAKSLTQADLIAEALETEEVNRASLLAFYAAEEDRRAADRIAGLRYEIYGPKLTFLSRVEGVERKEKGKAVERGVAATETDKMESGRRRLIEVLGEAGKEGWRPEVRVAESAAAGAAARGEGSELPPPSTTNGLSATTSSLPSEPPPLSVNSLESAPIAIPSVENGIITSQPPPPSLSISTPAPVASTSALHSDPLPNSTVVSHPLVNTFPPRRNASPPPPPPPPAVEPHSRNYLILGEFEGSRAQEMGAIFGQHHEWGSVKVIPSRSRVLSTLPTSREFR